MDTALCTCKKQKSSSFKISQQNSICQQSIKGGPQKDFSNEAQTHTLVTNLLYQVITNFLQCKLINFTAKLIKFQWKIVLLGWLNSKLVLLNIIQLILNI